MKRTGSDIAINIYLVLTAVLSLASVLDDFVDIKNGFAISGNGQWLLIAYLLWVPVSIVFIFIGARCKRPGASLVAAGVVLNMILAIAAVVALNVLSPSAINRVGKEKKTLPAFVYFDLVVQPMFIIPCAFLLRRYSRPQKKKDDGRLISVDDG